MAIKRLSLKVISPMNGLEDYFPAEMQAGVQELIRRYNVNLSRLMSDLVSQVPVDTSVLPDMASGSSTAATYSMATTDDLKRLDMRKALGS